MLELVTVALALCSYFEIKTSSPLLTARIPTHSGATAPVGQVMGFGLWVSFFLQVFLSALLLAAPYVGTEAIHFGSWCLGNYPPEQRDRIMPLLRQLMALLSLLVSLYFALCIHLRIHGALSHGPVLPADWLDRAVRTDLEWMVGLMLACGAIIYRYLGRFDEIAGVEP
jgi:hypothetical protein